MKLFSFVHAADIHLDSPLKGLFQYEGAPDVEDIRGATRQALDNLVSFVLSEKVSPFFETELYSGLVSQITHAGFLGNRNYDKIIYH